MTLDFFLQNAVPECQSLQNGRANTFLHRLYSNQGANPREGRRGRVWEGLCRGGWALAFCSADMKRYVQTDMCRFPIYSILLYLDLNLCESLGFIFVHTCL